MKQLRNNSLPFFVFDTSVSKLLFHHCKNSSNYFLLLSFLFFSKISFSQQNSPYSRYGLGELYTDNFPVKKSMGGIYSAFNTPSNINFQNPASYSSVKYTTFESGIFISSVNLQTNKENQNIQNANLSHIAFVFPVAKKCGLSIGLIPFSRMDYKIDESDTLNSNITVDSRKNGNGNLYQFYLGSAYKIGKFSIGANASYFFGKLYRQTTLIFSPADSFYLNDRKTSSNSYGSIIWNAGLQYSDTLSKSLIFEAGINGRISQNVKVTSEQVWERLDFDRFPQDTLVNANVKGKIVLPAEFGVGIILKKENQWLMGAQFDYGKWSDYTYFGQNDSLLADSWRVGIGGGVIPDYKSLKYFKSIQYRLGFFMGNDYLYLKQKHLSYYGITFGFGLPIRKNMSKLNLAFEIGQRGTTDNNLIKENFLKAHIGITINDVWFLKRKYD